jgi:glycosyltransferase involved in cell wall biosynthesis
VARRILLLITDLEIGGTPTVVRELAIRLPRATRDVHVEVACLKGWGPVADQLRDAGVTVTALGATRVWQLPRIVRDLRPLVRDRAIDTVFSFLVHANLVAALASRKLDGVRFFQSIQTTQPKPGWHWRAQCWAQTHAEKIMVPSPSVKRVAAEWSDIPANKIVVVPNAIDPGEFEPSLISNANLRPYPIGFIGRLDPIKRLPMLLRAVKNLNGLVHLHIFGDGIERARIPQEIKELGINSQITMHGTVAHPQQALKQIGLLVLPSQAEGFGLVLIEAMAAGVPVIAADAPGVRDVIQNQINGNLVPIDEMAKAIAGIVEDRSARDRLIEGGIKTVNERYTWDIVLPQYRAALSLD